MSAKKAGKGARTKRAARPLRLGKQTVKDLRPSGRRGAARGGVAGVAAKAARVTASPDYCASANTRCQ